MIKYINKSVVFWISFVTVVLKTINEKDE